MFLKRVELLLLSFIRLIFLDPGRLLLNLVEIFLKRVDFALMSYYIFLYAPNDNMLDCLQLEARLSLFAVKTFGLFPLLKDPQVTRPFL